MNGIDASTRMVGAWKLWESWVGALSIAGIVIAGFVMMKFAWAGVLLMLVALVSMNLLWFSVYRTRAERTAEFKRRSAGVSPAGPDAAP